MPRKPKPFFRKQTQSWYCSIGGRQIPLGKNEELAHQKFHELMADQGSVSSELTTLYDLSQTYLDWCKANRSEATYDKHLYFLKSFIGFVGKRLKIAALKQHHLTKWLADNPDWGANSGNDAISIVQRMINWAIEEGYVDRQPIARMKKPRRKRRDVVYTEAQWASIKENAHPSIIDLLDFLYLTGCRPQEARGIEARHIHDDLVIFPADESKGETDPRVIFLPPEAKSITDRLLVLHPSGALFRNSRGNAWTKNAVNWSLRRVTAKVGFRVIAYGARHSYATNALTQGGVDPVSLSHFMGHKDPTMVSRDERLKRIRKNPIKAASQINVPSTESVLADEANIQIHSTSTDTPKGDSAHAAVSAANSAAEQ
ncbi:MAG: tyrosine-type recombinase/integrase [Pirellulales bacterium]|nr:tyrosine-type recombinase/integrase [Pirellulales bacterium]